MSPEARERYLLGWAGSRLGLRRSAFGAFRKLMTFLAYADPGLDAPNPRLARIGYEADPRPIAAEPTPIVPTRLPFDDGSPDDPLVMDADAVVVGSGAGGGIAAAALAEAGRSVIVLEAGPFADERTMPTNELDAFDRHYLNHGLLATWDGAITMLSGQWRRRRHARQLDDQHRGPGGRPRRVDDRTRLARRDRHRVGAGRRRRGARSWASTESTGIPPKDAAILRGAEALGWEAASDAAERDGLRRVRQLSVRVHEGHEAVRHPGPSRATPTRRAPGSSRGSASCASCSRAVARSASKATPW